MTSEDDPPPDEESERDAAPERGRGDLFAVAFVILLTLGAIWLVRELIRHNEILNCVASGRRDCVEPIRLNDSPP
jgi:flagellar biogenesis protein FliO